MNPKIQRYVDVYKKSTRELFTEHNRLIVEGALIICTMSRLIAMLYNVLH